MMYGGRKFREKGEKLFEKARERHGRESLEVQGVTITNLVIISLNLVFYFMLLKY